METVAVTDLYQASYLLLSGCQLTEASCTPSGTKALSCTLYFSGQHLATLEENWFSKRAMVNLWAFRQAYSQVHQYVDQAKKEFVRNGGGLV